MREILELKITSHGIFFKGGGGVGVGSSGAAQVRQVEQTNVYFLKRGVFRSSPGKKSGVLRSGPCKKKWGDFRWHIPVLP